jgi:Tol biopolymer transport system component/predicted Ser/Thr protein kinase
MGEFYKARDTRLDRTVAIKVLPSHVASDPARRQRFEREARAISSLDHPHICALYDVGRHENTDFLVMQYLEGETLAARLAGGPLPLHRALEHAIEIANALDRAHRQGIVHRDLKPGNVMLTKDGAKLLDFGLAKPPRVLSSAATMTATAPVTAAGTLLGTLQYMAPEQLQGRDADARSDIWAFGCVVHEMLTGRPVFAADSQAGVIAAILDRDPASMDTAGRAVPPALERLVRKCLAKDPDARWQTAHDLADALRWLDRDSASPPVAAVPPTPGRRSRARWVVPAVVIGIAAAVLFVPRWMPGPPPPGADAVHRQLTFEGDVWEATLSPDGRTVVYSVGEDRTAMRVLARDVAGPQPLELWRGTRVADVKWLPGGSHVLVAGDQAGRKGVWNVPRLGGPAPRLDAEGYILAPSPDGSHVAFADQGSQGFTVVPLGGGAARRVTLSGFRFLLGLLWTSRGNRLILPTRTDTGEFVVWSVRPTGEDQQRVYGSKVPIGAVCDSPIADALYVFAGQKLLRLPLSDRALIDPVVLLSGLDEVGGPSRTCTVSADGQTVLMVKRTSHANLWRFDLTDAATTPLALTQGTSDYRTPSMSPDGRWVAFADRKQGAIFRMAASGGDRILLRPGAAPAWSPDGRRLAFLLDEQGERRPWVGDADGRGAVAIAGASLGNAMLTWLGNERLAWPTPDARNYRIRDVTTGGEELLVKNESVGFVFVPMLSPKGDRVALFWNRGGGASGLWTISWPAREERFLAAALEPDGWSPDGEWIYAHRSETAALVKVSATTGEVRPVGTFPLGTLTLLGCSVSRDGAVAICSLTDEKSDAWSIENFDLGAR